MSNVSTIVQQSSKDSVVHTVTDDYCTVVAVCYHATRAWSRITHHSIAGLPTLATLWSLQSSMSRELSLSNLGCQARYSLIAYSCISPQSWIWCPWLKGLPSLTCLRCLSWKVVTSQSSPLTPAHPLTFLTRTRLERNRGRKRGKDLVSKL